MINFDQLSNIHSVDAHLGYASMGMFSSAYILQQVQVNCRTNTKNAQNIFYYSSVEPTFRLLTKNCVNLFLYSLLNFRMSSKHENCPNRSLAGGVVTLLSQQYRCTELELMNFVNKILSIAKIIKVTKLSCATKNTRMRYTLVIKLSYYGKYR